MSSLWFITPAFGRFELTEVCLEQRARVIARLAEEGIEGRCVVIADDANLDIARGLGFDTVERDNRWLGRRFNDGYQYAGRHGADWIVPIGSDDFVDPAYLLPLPSRPRTGHHYAPVETLRLAECRVGGIGAGPRMYPAYLMARRGFRPAPEEQQRGVDHATVRGLGRMAWEWVDRHPLQYVGFRRPPFTTRYARLWIRWGVVERWDPWARLARVYPPDLVERARKVMQMRVAA